MKYIFYLILASTVFCQTHLSIPKSVWRIQTANEIFSGDWIGPDGEKGINGMQSLWNGKVWNIDETRSLSASRTSFRLDYGFSDRMHVSVSIPYFSILEENKSFSVSPADTTVSSPDSIISRFHPSKRTNSGLGDVTLGLSYLFYGTPTWSGKGSYTLYGGFSVVLPTAERLGPFSPGSVDTSGIPLQFYELPIGHGLTEYRISLGGEFYRKILGRMATLRWNVHYASFSQEQVHTSLSFVGFDEPNPDSLAAMIGDKHLYKHGNIFTGTFSGRLEILPEKLIVEAGVDWKFSGRDFFKSNSSTWDSWMEYRKVKGSIIHSTRRVAINQYISILYQNVDPINKIGPIPFELEARIRLPMPLLVRNGFNTASFMLGLTTYTQMW